MYSSFDTTRNDSQVRGKQPNNTSLTGRLFLPKTKCLYKLFQRKWKSIRKLFVYFFFKQMTTNTTNIINYFKLHLLLYFFVLLLLLDLVQKKVLAVKTTMLRKLNITKNRTPKFKSMLNANHVLKDVKNVLVTTWNPAQNVNLQKEKRIFL